MRALAIAALVVTVACAPDPPVLPAPPSCTSDADASCAIDRECPGQSRCDTQFGCCVSTRCTSDADCGRRNGQVCDVPTGICGDRVFCADTLATRVDVPIGTSALTCSEGVCLYDDGDPRCVESAPAPFSCEITPGAVTVSGRAVRMEVLALDVDGAPAAYPPAATWTAVNADVDGALVTPTCLGPDVCFSRVTARLGDIECSDTLRVFPSLADGESRVIVIDATSRAPLADVRVDVEVDGAFLTSTTDANGALVITGNPTIVSAFPEDHEWHTVLAPPAEIVLATVSMEPLARTTGTVDHTRLHTQGDLKIALTGRSLPSLVDFELTRLLGESTPTPIELEGITDPGEPIDWQLPSALTWFLGNNTLRGEWLALGDGPLAWSFAAQAPLAELGSSLNALGSTTPSFGRISAVLLTPVLDRGDHFVGVIGAPIAPSVLHVSEREVTVGEHLAPDVVTVALARVPGRGLVPLGASSAGTLDFAPPHDGLEGSEVRVAAVALDLDALVDSSSRVTVQAAFAPLGSENEIVMPPFLAQVQGTFDGASVTSSNDPTAALYRVRFDDGADARWSVWSAAPPTFALADVHAGDVDVLARGAFARVDAIATDVFAVELPPLDGDVSALSSTPLAE